MKISLVGCGDIANRYYGQALVRLKQEGLCSALFVCDIDGTKAANFAKRFHGDRSFNDVHHLVSEARPDCIILTVPVQSIASLAIDLAPYAIPLLIEKPPARTVEEATQLAEALETHGVLHQVAFNRHHMPVIKTLQKKLVDDKQTLQHIYSVMSRYRRAEPTFSDTAIHSIDLIRFLANSPYASLRLTYQDLPHYGNGTSNIFMDCKFVNGVRAHAAMMVCSGTVNERLTLTGNDTTYEAFLPVWECDDTPGLVRCWEHNTERCCISGETLGEIDGYVMSGFYEQLVRFVTNVRTEHQPLESMAYAMQSIAIAQCIALRKSEYKE